MDKIPEVVRTAPEHIWLQVDASALGDGDEPFPDDPEGVTWCQDSVAETEVEYVRADLAQTIDLAAIRDVSFWLTSNSNWITGAYEQGQKLICAIGDKP